MDDLSNDDLVKRAGYARTNLAALAVLSTLVAVFMVVMAFHGGAVAALGPMAAFIRGTAIAFCLVAGGYWTLMVAAKRGDPTAVTIPLVLALGHLALSFLLQGIVAAKKGASANVTLSGAIIPILVIIALHKSRSALIELKERGLWEAVFQPVKPTGTLCLVGGILVVVGLLGFDGMTFYAGHKASEEVADERQSVQVFVNLIKNDEKDLMNSVGTSPKDALDKAGALEKKILALQQDASQHSQLADILTIYGNAVRQWKNGLAELNQPSPDKHRVQQLLGMGDKLREQAVDAFQKRYASQQHAGM